ncbi:DUF4333 domain-containing protein [Mumia zhuanghuii]|uniref:DUF4333 domain-containing protein n=2 Tax=Mumia TaxID=1546255 RepID=A0ABW1QRN5_9ACTN|nr:MULTISPECIES: DUF4333 domain-containing protein [Mumia]KAA1423231.1 DUF4333 domain-containing protein [Mumia zhuanghuii]
MRIPVRALAVCCAVVPVIAACGSDPIDTARLEQRIKVGYERQVDGTSVKSVTCPTTIEREPGVTATCRLTLSTGVSGKIDIRVRDDRRIEWEVAGKVG